MKFRTHLHIIVSFIFILGFTEAIFSQNDTIDKTKIFDGEKPPTSLKVPLQNFESKTPNITGNKNNFFKNNIEKKNNWNISDKKPKRRINFANNDEDSDILTMHYYNGKKVTNERKSIKSNYNLGTLYTHSNFVKIEVRDFGLQDGDRIRVYVNNEVVQNNITLENLSFFIQVNLKNGYNSISIRALNQGYVGPNTAELEIYNDKGTNIASHSWSIDTGEVVALGIYRE